MRVLIVGILLLTLGVAAVSTYLIKSFQTPEAIEELERQKQIPKKFVLVAARDLDTGEAIRKEDVAWQVWIDEGIRPEYVVRQEGAGGGKKDDLVKPFIGARVRSRIAAGEPLLSGKIFNRDNPGFLSAVLRPGMRAATIQVSAATSAAGFILPGDRVDIMLTHNRAQRVLRKAGASDGDDLGGPYASLTWTTETILRDVEVLSVDRKTGEVKGNAKVGKMVVVEVTPKQAQILTVANRLGNLSLSLRSVAPPPEAGEEPSLHYTTDLEASPLLRSIVEREQAARQQQMQEQLRRLRQQQAQKAEQTEQTEQKPAPAPKPRPSLKVFRGRAWSTEEIKGEAQAQ